MSLTLRMDKENIVHLHNGVLLGGKNKQTNKNTFKFAGKWTELEKNILSEVTQTQKDKYDMYSLISGY